MPARDGTGPWGAGPRTGKGMGWCAPASGAMGRAVESGFGLGRGRWGCGVGRGWGLRAAWGRGAFGWGWMPPMVRPWTREEQLRWLQGYKAHLEEALESARKQMAELEKESQA